MKNQHYAFLLCLILILFSSCKPDEPAMEVPVLSSTAAENLEGTTATLGGNVTAAGSSEVDSRGVCWGLNANPTINDNSQFADGSGLGSFSVDIDGLDPNTTYHFRAFAQNSNGIGYGNDLTFNTGEIFTFTTQIARDITAKRVRLAADIEAPASIGGIYQGICVKQITQCNHFRHQ